MLMRLFKREVSAADHQRALPSYSGDVVSHSFMIWHHAIVP
jgi:hypothetical protein